LKIQNAKVSAAKAALQICDHFDFEPKHG
jgi:hypothetical protein